MNNQVITESELELLEDQIITNLFCADDVYLFDYHIETIKKLIANYKASKQKGWISCSDQLPENEDILCLIWCDNDYDFAFYVQGCDSWDSPLYGWICNKDIGGWQYLPQPPHNALDEATEGKE